MITLSGIILTFEGIGTLDFSYGSVFVLMAAVCAMILGFASYGLSIFFYIRAQNVIGSAKTSAYYAAAPFIGVMLSFLLLHEELSRTYMLVLAVMAAGTILVVMDTLILSHTHEHTHAVIRSHGELHLITHSHVHSHYVDSRKHKHFHS